MFKHSLSRNLDAGQQRSSLAATFWWWFCGHWEGAAQNIVFLNISLTPLWPVWPGDQATQTGCAIRSVETTTILTPINRCILINKSRLQWEINRWLAEEIFPFSMLLTTSWMRISEAGCCVFSGCLDMNGKNGFNLFCSGKLDPRLRNFNSMKNC